MPLNVLGGPLEFEATIDTSKLESQLQEGFKKGAAVLDEFNNNLQQTAAQTSQVFDSAPVDKYVAKVKQAGETVQSLLAKGFSGVTNIDPSKISDLRAQVEGTADEFKKLELATDFINKNFASFNLNEQEFQQLSAAIEVVNTSFEKMAEIQQAPIARLKEIREELAQLEAAGADKGSPRFQQLTAEAATLEESINKVNKALELTSRPLEFKAAVDTSQLQAQLKEGFKKGEAAVDDFNAVLKKSASKTAQAFDVNPVNKFAQAIAVSTAKIQPLLQKGLSGLDPSKLEELEQQLALTTDKFKQLQILTGFIKDNLNDLNLNPDEVKELSQAVDFVGKSFDGLSDKQLAPLTRLRQIRNELAQLKLEGQDEGSPQFQKLTAEATELEHAMRNVNKALTLGSGETPGLAALQQGFRGILGGAEAAAGALGLFTEDEKEAAVITKNLVAIMSILNGVEELGAVLAKDSALNQFLLSKFRASNAVAATEQAVATEAAAVAEAESVVATEAATAAQIGFNAALLANPVGLILAGIVALFGAYEILSHTIFATTEEEKKHLAAQEALIEAQGKSADTIASEQASMQVLLATSKDLSLNNASRISALEKLRQKYPEHLSNLKLETLYTKQAADAIEKQTKLIRQKALATAAEEVYKDKLKEVLTAQADLNKEVGLFEGIWNNLKTGQVGTGTLATMQVRLADLKEKTDAADGAFNTMIDTNADLQRSQQPAIVSTQDLIVELTKLEKVGGNTNLFTGWITGLKNLQTQIGKTVDGAFSPELFDEQKKKILAEYQFRLDNAKKGSSQELKIRKDLHDKELALNKLDVRLFDEQGKPNEQGLSAFGKLQSDINDINQAAAEKLLQNISDTSQAIVLRLQAAGKAGTDAYFNAQKKSIQDAAKAEIQSAGDNAGTIKRIRAQLALDLHNLDIQQQTQSLENTKSFLQVRLNLAKEGSAEELQARLQLLDVAAKAEILQAGKNTVRINEINSNTAKEKAELEKKFEIEANQTVINTILAGIETKLAAIQEGSAEELDLKKQLIEEKSLLDIEEAKGQIRNEELLAAKILEIKAKSLNDQRKLDKEYFKDLLQKQLQAIEDLAENEKANLQVVIDNPRSNLRTRQDAQQSLANIEVEKIKAEMRRIAEDIGKGRGDVADLDHQYTALQIKLKKAESDVDNVTVKNFQERMKFATDIISSLSARLDVIADSLKDINPQVAELLKSLSEAGKLTNDVSHAITEFKKDTKEGNQQGASDLIGVVILLFNKIAQAISSKKAVKKEVQDFMDSLILGEVEYTRVLRERERQQVLVNKRTLEGLTDQNKLLKEQKKITTDSFNEVLKQLQQEQFIAKEFSGDDKKKRLGLAALAGVVNLLFRDKKAKQELESLAGKSFEEIEKLFNTGQLTDKAKDLFLQLQKIKQEGVDIDALLAENAVKMQEALTGTTSSSIVDSIVEGFAQGKHSAADFADLFQDLMRGAIIQALKFKFLEEPLQEFFKEFASASESGGQLTSGEIADLKRLYESIITNANAQFDQLQQISGLNLNAQPGQGNSLSGAIKGITEQQADLLAGQFGGLRLTALDHLNVSRSSLNALNEIQANTGLAAVRLVELINKHNSYETGAKYLTVKVI